MIKNFDEIGCLYCGSANIKTDTICKSCARNLHIEKDLIRQQVDRLTLVDFVARGFYGLTFRAEDNNEKSFAIKLISSPAYIAQNKDFNGEMGAYAKLPNHPCIAQYGWSGEAVLKVHEYDLEFYFMVSEWIPGPTLKEWITHPSRQPKDLYNAAHDLLSALQAFDEVQLWHNDLHEENILILRLTESQRRSLRRKVPYILKIVDIGSARFKSSAGLKEISDLNNIGRHLTVGHAHLFVQLHEFTKEDRQFLLSIRNFCTRLADENPSRGFGCAEEALDSIEEIWRNSRHVSVDAEELLSDPYGLTNAMDIPSPMLIREMFSDKFKYFSRIESLDNHAVIVTGPRGCGKTMILRRMSFECALPKLKNSSSDNNSWAEYIGLFISARMVFGNFLVAARNPKWASDPDLLALYFNILITQGVIDLLYSLVEKGLEDELSTDGVINLIVDRFNLPPSDLYTCKSDLVKIAQKIILSDNSGTCKPNSLNATPSYLEEIVNTLQKTVPSIRGKKILILLDDFSWPRIPEGMMKILVPFLFNTGSSYKTRVSAHSDGIILTSLAGEKYEENRDFIEINLGREYFFISDDYDTCVHGFDDIMNRRFKLAKKGDFPGIKRMLGTGEDLQDLGSHIQKLAKEKKLRTLRYNGSHVFVKLCSGDLSYLLDILGHMSSRWGDKDFPIGTSIQHNVIRTYARNQLQLLRDLKTQKVTSLHDVGLSFGRMSRAKLVATGREHLRIEIEYIDLASDLWEAMKELLSSGLFIDGGYSNNNKGIPVRRLLFRRIYTPAFPTTVNNRNTFPMTATKFRNFILFPFPYAEEIMSNSGLSRDEQNNLEKLEHINDEF